MIGWRNVADAVCTFAGGWYVVIILFILLFFLVKIHLMGGKEKFW